MAKRNKTTEAKEGLKMVKNNDSSVRWSWNSETLVVILKDLTVANKVTWGLFWKESKGRYSTHPNERFTDFESAFERGVAVLREVFGHSAESSTGTSSTAKRLSQASMF